MGMSGSSEDVLRSSETDDSSSRLGDLELGLKESSKSLLSCSDVVDRSDILDSVRESTQPSSRLELPELPCGNDFHVTLISCFGGGCVPLLSSSKEPLSRAPSIIAISRRSIMAIEHELESGSSLSGVQVLVSSLLERSVLSLSFLSMERRLESAISAVSFVGSSSDNSSTTRFGERSRSLTIICSILLIWSLIVFSSACPSGISGNGIFSMLSCFSKLSSGAFRLSFSIFALRSKFCFISMLTISAKFRAAFSLASTAFAILVGLLGAPSRDFFFCITETIVTLESVGDFLGERLRILFGLSEGLNIDFGLVVVTVPLFGLSGDSLLLAFSIEESLVRSKYGRSVTIFSGNFGKSLARLLTFLEVLLLSDSDFSSDAVPFITCLLCNIYGISTLFFCIAALSENGSSSPESAGVKSMDF
ncbi:hypothetical protein ALC60_06235 [Trachymyrmex zeteki]|uniref:Uncharacterized protein n=1 Tax=Mycetomoellerius zeteki TaxID=64791 RepID=A0A151X3P5_9HYME|nr:hypothetical protein ALC60_06235 [Trachymyrmex zeteki]